MVSSIARALVGENTTTAGIPATDMGMGTPVLNPALRRKVKPKPQISEDGLIPNDATCLTTDAGAGANTNLAGSVQVPAYADSDDTLMHPTLALVAPDLTPDGLLPLSPGDVPEDVRPIQNPRPADANTNPADPQSYVDPAMDLLTRANQQRQESVAAHTAAPIPSVSAVLGSMGGGVSPITEGMAGNPLDTSRAMPDHVRGDAKVVAEAARGWL
jgi:hypothetical protein